MTGWYLFASVVLLLANAYFVAVEFAFVDQPARAAGAAGRGPGGAAPTSALGSMRHLSLQLAGAQLGITMASLGLGFVAEPAFAHLLESLARTDRPARGGHPRDRVRRGLADRHRSSTW